MLSYDGIAIDKLACPYQMELVNGCFKWLRIEFTMFIYVKIFFMHVIYKLVNISINGRNKIYMAIL
jgi:hypothetical protein